MADKLNAIDLRRLSRAAAAADIRAARRRIAELREMLTLEGAAPGARRFIQEQIGHEQRRARRLLANARAASAPSGELTLREQMESDGTFDRLVEQFKDDKRQAERAERIVRAAEALIATPANRELPH
jgi:hypothetical protein